jgi:hypothetical protein
LDNWLGRDEDEVVEEQKQPVSECVRLYTVTELPARSEAQLPSAIQKEAGTGGVFDRRWESREATALPQRHRRWSRPDGRVDFGMWLDSPGAEDASHVKGNANSTSTLGLHRHFPVPHRVLEDLGRMTPAQPSYWLASRRLSVFSLSSPESS